ncbi:SRPBCC family protein [Tengunoibacter tsumagoiensis]|uniref:Activator of Hsp90 ATPase homologue 1/2-like C-terminal domain-containing protein n=1 Tax=Tengunoibacter tsumagoiensis TaxID=2014871 RepID=A0A402A8U3_9CHLR|nr:SRPBCC family protein [Tengunoibacter tsumagoiensis]GCE15572.1 hypothetical protein KTT_54310 [Tengunoibacter tsumagoiensis]
MNTNISRITINAPAAQVWNAITQPELVKQWQYGTDLITSWQAGSPIIFRNEWEGKIFEQKGTVFEFVPYSLVRYTLFAPRPDLEDAPENYLTMIYQLQETNGQTTLSIIQNDPRPRLEPATSESESTDESENSVLTALKQLVEG